MARRNIALCTRAEFDVLRARLEHASEALRRDGCRLQSVARAYYVVYALASYLAGRYGVRATHVRAGKQVTDQDFSHAELPALVYALYTGLKKDSISDPGSSPGIGAGNFDERLARRHADTLVQIRFEADYGPSVAEEPYGEGQTDTWLTIAKSLTQDLESVL